MPTRFALLLLCALATAQAADAPPAPINAPAWKTPPRALRAVEPGEFPEEARRAGHFGIVRLSFTVDALGVVRDLQVSLSSRSPLLDAQAMRALIDLPFEPARDAAGQALAVKVQQELQFLQADVFALGCEEMLAMEAWRAQAWPERALLDMPGLRRLIPMDAARTLSPGADDASARQRALALGLQACADAPAPRSSTFRWLLQSLAKPRPAG